MIKKIILIGLTIIGLTLMPVLTLAVNTYSASFNGTTQYLYAADSASLSITGTLTLEAWIYFSSNPDVGDEKHIINKANGTTNGYVLRYIPGAGGYMTVWQDDTTKCQYNTTNFTPSINTWYHIAGVWTGTCSETKIFINGTLATLSGSGAATSIGDNALSMNIGASTAPDRYFPGLIDEPRVSNSVRYSGNFSVQTEDFTNDANTAALYHFNADLTTDSSSNSNTLTNVNTVTQSSTVPYTGAVAAKKRDEDDEIIIFN